MWQGAAELPAEAVAFGCDFFTSRLRQPHHEADELKGCKKPKVVLIIHNDMVI